MRDVNGLRPRARRELGFRGVDACLRARRARWIVTVIASFLAMPMASAAATTHGDHPRPFWGELIPGSHPVGYETHWEADPARVYDFTFEDGSRYSADGKAPRPILVNVWYPADARDADEEPMTHGDYLTLDADDPALEKLSLALGQYAREAIAEWAVGAKEDQLDGFGAAELGRLLSTRTAAIRDARPADGPFPLALYHAGYGSSFEDNAVLCEYLASHGYVVVGSAFLEESGDSFNIDGKSGSVRDLSFLIQATARMPYVDWTKVAVIGHSGGAHASLEFQAMPMAAVDAVISLDTTQDYGSVLDPHWTHARKMVESVEYETAPLLMVARPNAYFEAGDRLVNAERYYLTFRDLDHNDYTLQGVWTAEIAARRARNSEQVNAEERATYAAAARRGFEQCCEYARLFLDAHLKRDAAATTRLATLYRTTPLAGDDPHVEYVPTGAGGPAPYDVESESARPPTPREAVRLIDDAGAEALLEILKRFHPRDPKAPIFHNQFAYGVLHGLVASGRVGDARVLAPFFHELHPTLVKSYVWWIDRDGPGKHMEFKRHALTAALLLDPDNADVGRRLRALEDEQGPE